MAKVENSKLFKYGMRQLEEFTTETIYDVQTGSLGLGMLVIKSKNGYSFYGFESQQWGITRAISSLSRIAKGEEILKFPNKNSLEKAEEVFFWITQKRRKQPRQRKP